MADSESEMTNQPPNVDLNVEMIDEEDILGITEGSQEEGEIMDDEKINEKEKSMKNKRKQDVEDPEMEETGQRKLRKTSKPDYKKLATGKGKGSKSNPKQRKPTTPIAQHLDSENDDETTGGKPQKERTGVKPDNPTEKEAHNEHQGEQATEKDEGEKAPTEYPGEKAPNAHPGEEAPIEHRGEKAPIMDHRGEKAPIEHRGEKAPREHQGEKAPIEHRGEKAPKGQRGENLPKDSSSSQESDDDSESTTTEADEDTAIKYRQEIMELKEMTEDLKKVLAGKKKESETHKKNLRLRTKELEETEKENRRLRRELEEVKKVTNTLKRENEELEDRLNTEERTNEQNKEEIRDLKERLQTEENEKENHRKVKEEIKRNRTEIQEQLEETKKQLAHTKKKLAESENMNEELIHRITKESQKSATSTTNEYHLERRKKTRALLIGDSNAKRIKPHLQDDTAWFITENTYRIEDISKVEGINEYDCCVVLLGTNNLKTGNDGIHEARKLLTTLEKYIRIPKLVCEAPPINRRTASAERKLYNVTLQNQIEKMKNTSIIKTPKETENSPTEEALSDDLHLNSHHSTLLANKISAIVREVKPKKHHEEKNSETEMTIEAEEEEIKAVIGGGHSKAAELEKEYDVRIKATRHNPNKISIHGKKEQVKRVHDLLKKKTRDLKERRDRNAEQKESRSKVPCIFYAQRRCVKGEKCHFLHERRRPSRERGQHERSRSPSAGTSDSRTVRIRPRDNE